MPNRSLSEPCAMLAAAVLLASCQPEAESDDGGNVQANTVIPALPVEGPKQRADILQDVARAASAAAAGLDDSEAQRALDGKLFEFRLRFGCRGPAVEGADGPLSWSFDKEKRTLRLRAAPTIAASDAVVAAIAQGATFEAIEGFWIPRPWLLSATCPVPATPSSQSQAESDVAEDEGVATSPADEAEPAQGESVPPIITARVGLAEFFTATDARTGRRDHRAYETTKALDSGENPSPQGYDLVLSGRLTRIGTSDVIACHVVARDRPPDCIVSAKIDRVRLESPGTRKIIAEWND